MTDQEILDAIDAKIRASEKAILETVSSKLVKLGDRVVKEISTG